MRGDPGRHPLLASWEDAGPPFAVLLANRVLPRRASLVSSIFQLRASPSKDLSHESLRALVSLIERSDSSEVVNAAVAWVKSLLPSKTAAEEPFEPDEIRALQHVGAAGFPAAYASLVSRTYEGMTDRECRDAVSLLEKFVGLDLDAAWTTSVGNLISAWLKPPAHAVRLVLAAQLLAQCGAASPRFLVHFVTANGFNSVLSMLELRAITYPAIVPHLLKVLEDSLTDARTRQLLLRSRPVRCLSSLLRSRSAAVAVRSLKIIQRILSADERGDPHFINDLFNNGIVCQINTMLQGSKPDVLRSCVTVLTKMLDYHFVDQVRRVDVQGVAQLLNLYELLESLDAPERPSMTADHSARGDARLRVSIATPGTTATTTAGEDGGEVDAGRKGKEARDELMRILCGVIAHNADADGVVKTLLQDHGREHIMDRTAKPPVKRAPPKPPPVESKVAATTEKHASAVESSLLEFSEDTPMKEKTIAPILQMMSSKDMYQRTQATSAMKKITARKVVDKDDLCLMIIKSALQRLTNEDDTIVAHACGILSNIARTKKNLPLLRMVDGIQPIVKCLESYHPLVLQDACRAVRALSADPLTANELFRMSAVPLLIMLVRSADDVIRMNAKASYHAILEHGGSHVYAASKQLIATNPWEIVQKQWRCMEAEETDPTAVQTLMARGRLPGAGGGLGALVSDIDVRHLAAEADMRARTAGGGVRGARGGRKEKKKAKTKSKRHAREGREETEK